MRIIETARDVADAAESLARDCPDFARVYALTGPLPLRRKPEGFAELLSAIVSQQVSTASAAAIWARVQDAELLTPDAVLAAGEEGLRAQGLSRPKIRYALALARAGIDFDALARMPDQEVIGSLTAVTGIGPWTAEIYAMFSLGRADVFPAGDLALQEAARLMFDLNARPGPAALRQLVARYAPLRSVAARLLWAYYRLEKQREGIR